jgi:hypothetical protein
MHIEGGVNDAIHLSIPFHPLTVGDEKPGASLP